MKNKKHGFGIHAFSDDARKTFDEIVANEEKIDDLIYWVESESIVVISGPKNSGKTRMALEVIEEFRGEGKVIYVDLDTYNKELDIGHLLVGNQSFFRKVTNKMPDYMILIVDNAHSLDNDFYRRLQYYFDQNYLRSVVLIKKTGADLKLPDSMMSRIGNKVINLSPLSKEEAVEIMFERLEGFIAEAQLEKIWMLSKDFENFLENCEKVVIESEEEDKDIDNKFIEKVLK